MTSMFLLFFFCSPLQSNGSLKVTMDNEVTKAQIPSACVRHFEMREFAYFNLCKPKRNVSSVRHFINIGSKYCAMFFSLLN